MPRPSSTFLLLVAVVASGCAEGGREDRVDSSQKIAADLTMLGFKGEQAFPQFPVTTQDLQVETGLLAFDMQGNWTIDGQRGSRYELSSAGALVFRVPNGRSADLVFQGGFGLEGDTGLFFFADTVKPKVGLFYGARRVTGLANVTGDWHVFALDVLTPPSGTVVAPDNVARAMAGSITTNGSGQITAGTARDSTNTDLTLTGSLSPFANGAVEIGLTRASAGGSSAGAWSGAATITRSQPVTTSVILGLETAANTQAGVLALVRKRDGRAAAEDLAGDYWVGIVTVFVNPSNAGTEGSYGTLTLTKELGWRLDATDSRASYRLSGTYQLDADGALRLTHNATNEQWLGAFDQDYKTVVFVDHATNVANTTRPELNFFLALRKKVVTP